MSPYEETLWKDLTFTASGSGCVAPTILPSTAVEKPLRVRLPYELAAPVAVYMLLLSPFTPDGGEHVTVMVVGGEAKPVPPPGQLASLYWSAQPVSAAKVAQSVLPSPTILVPPRKGTLPHSLEDQAVSLMYTLSDAPAAFAAMADLPANLPSARVVTEFVSEHVQVPSAGSISVSGALTVYVTYSEERPAPSAYIFVARVLYSAAVTVASRASPSYCFPPRNLERALPEMSMLLCCATSEPG